MYKYSLKFQEKRRKPPPSHDTYSLLPGCTSAVIISNMSFHNLHISLIILVQLVQENIFTIQIQGPVMYGSHACYIEQGIKCTHIVSPTVKFNFPIKPISNSQLSIGQLATAQSEN